MTPTNPTIPPIVLLRAAILAHGKREEDRSAALRIGPAELREAALCREHWRELASGEVEVVVSAGRDGK